MGCCELIHLSKAKFSPDSKRRSMAEQPPASTRSSRRRDRNTPNFAQTATTISPATYCNNNTHVCPRCDFNAHSRVGLASHMRSSRCIQNVQRMQQQQQVVSGLNSARNPPSSSPATIAENSSRHQTLQSLAAEIDDASAGETLTAALNGSPPLPPLSTTSRFGIGSAENAPQNVIRGEAESAGQSSANHRYNQQYGNQRAQPLPSASFTDSTMPRSHTLPTFTYNVHQIEQISDQLGPLSPALAVHTDLDSAAGGAAAAAAAAAVTTGETDELSLLDCKTDDDVKRRYCEYWHRRHEEVFSAPSMETLNYWHAELQFFEGEPSSSHSAGMFSSSADANNSSTPQQPSSSNGSASSRMKCNVLMLSILSRTMLRLFEMILEKNQQQTVTRNTNSQLQFDALSNGFIIKITQLGQYYRVFHYLLSKASENRLWFVDLNSMTVEPFLLVGKVLRMDFIQAMVTRYTTMTLNTQRALVYLQVGRKADARVLQRAALERAARAFDDVAKSEDWLHAEMEDVLALVRSPRLKCSGENQVFAAIMRWVMHDIETRRPMLPDLLKNIRFQQFERKTDVWRALADIRRLATPQDYFTLEDYLFACMQAADPETGSCMPNDVKSQLRTNRLTFQTYQGGGEGEGVGGVDGGGPAANTQQARPGPSALVQRPSTAQRVPLHSQAQHPAQNSQPVQKRPMNTNAVSRAESVVMGPSRSAINNNVERRPIPQPLPSAARSVIGQPSYNSNVKRQQSSIRDVQNGRGAGDSSSYYRYNGGGEAALKRPRPAPSILSQPPPPQHLQQQQQHNRLRSNQQLQQQQQQQRRQPVNQSVLRRTSADEDEDDDEDDTGGVSGVANTLINFFNSSIDAVLGR